MRYRGQKASWSIRTSSLKFQMLAFLDVRIHCHLPVTGREIQGWEASPPNQTSLKIINSRQREDIVYRLCVQLAIVCLVISTTRKDQGLDDSSDFPCCMRSVSCRSISSCLLGEVRFGCIRIRGPLPFRSYAGPYAWCLSLCLKLRTHACN